MNGKMKKKRKKKREEEKGRRRGTSDGDDVVCQPPMAATWSVGRATGSGREFRMWGARPGDVRKQARGKWRWRVTWEPLAGEHARPGHAAAAAAAAVLSFIRVDFFI
ncbi:unnamed protein product [Urochloa humidicola]